MKRLKLSILLLIFSQLCADINAQKKSIKMTNVTCTALNVAYLKFTKCQLNKINKNDLAFSLYGKLMVKSLDNMKVIKINTIILIAYKSIYFLKLTVSSQIIS